MPLKKKSGWSKASLSTVINEQGASALLAATIQFLRSNNVSTKSIIQFARQYSNRKENRRASGVYRKLMRTYEYMGVIMATWFSDPRFLDSSGRPLPLSIGKGANSMAQLIRVSGACVQHSVAMELMRLSPSIKINECNEMVALRRVFVVPKMAVPRAAFVVERYLDTVQEIASHVRKDVRPLIERSCHVSEVDLTRIAPLLRDIEARGTAFMDAIDGDLEVCRLRRSKRKSVGELGVLVFAWSRPGGDALKVKKRLRKLYSR